MRHIGMICVLAVVSLPAFAQSRLEGRLLADVEQELAALEPTPQNRFELGATRFLRAVERLGQSLHRHGLRTRETGIGVPVLRMPVPDNPNPDPISADEFRAILAAFLQDLGEVEQTLAPIGDEPVKLTMNLVAVRMDLDGDGQPSPDETLGQFYVRLAQNPWGEPPPAPESMVIAFDTGDVYWLRGYCHLMSAMLETVLAHDFQEMFARVGHLAFARVETPHTYLQQRPEMPGGFNWVEVTDLIAMIHLLSLEVREPDRMQGALAHLEAVPAMSRASWRSILAETDDEREWVPSPKQTSVLVEPRVTQEHVDGWMRLLDEYEAIFAGRKLVPFWRPAGANTGVNLRKVFEEPTKLDLVLWVQGTAATPYLEEGELTTPDFWRNLNEVFDQNLMGFAIWFN